MSGKRSVPSMWASRGQIIAALTAVLMVAWAVAGAVLLFLPSPDRSGQVVPATIVTDGVPSESEDAEPEETDDPYAGYQRPSRTDFGSIKTVAPSPPPTPTAHPSQEDSATAEPTGGRTSSPPPDDPDGPDDPDDPPPPDDDRPGNGNGNRPPTPPGQG